MALLQYRVYHQHQQAPHTQGQLEYLQGWSITSEFEPEISLARVSTPKYIRLELQLCHLQFRYFQVAMSIPMYALSGSNLI